MSDSIPMLRAFDYSYGSASMSYFVPDESHSALLHKIYMKITSKDTIIGWD